jgi:hypothetical protein
MTALKAGIRKQVSLNGDISLFEEVTGFTELYKRLKEIEERVPVELRDSVHFTSFNYDDDMTSRFDPHYFTVWTQDEIDALELAAKKKKDAREQSARDHDFNLYKRLKERFEP